jgi:5-oxoprolinase (ATP-hydrolysing) subunit A
MLTFDLNCDLGEGSPNDAELMPLITSANIACGAHAGDPQTMLHTLRLAKQSGVRVGAHLAFPDREHFGRRELPRSGEEVFADCVAQIGALQGLARSEGVAVAYVKPHGALYNMACRDAAYARPVVWAARVFALPVMGLPLSVLETETLAAGLNYLKEGFADRRYQPDGSLVPRTQANAMIDNPDEAARQVKWLLTSRGVQSVCVHGDRPGVVPFTQRLTELLLKP